MKKSIVHTKYHLLLLTSLIKGGKDPCLSLKKYECITDNFSGQTTYLFEHRKKTKIYCAFFVPQLRHLENEQNFKRFVSFCNSSEQRNTR